MTTELAEALSASTIPGIDGAAGPSQIGPAQEL
jgi:hypothetical protein